MRYLALTQQDRQDMLSEIGVKSVDELYDTVPNNLLLKEPIENLESHKGEIEVESFLTNLANKNYDATKGPFFLGAGCYNHHIPATVDHIIQRSEFLTSYTPYQPEISQGTLASIFQFQSIISLLTGMEIANASMYDGATALAEAVLMAIRIKKKKKNLAIFNNLNPDYKNVLSTFINLVDAKITNYNQIDENTACVIVQYPDFYGNIDDLNSIKKKCEELDILLIVCITEIVSLGLLEAPSQADIVVGEASSIGVGLNYGGPHLGFFACQKKYVRQMPGRLCGITTDQDGKEGFVLTLSAREQHIRREKATSNICSNQGLCSTAFTIHTMLLGENGFKKLALINHKKACDLADRLKAVNGIEIVNDSFFNEFVIKLSKDSNMINRELLKNGIIGGLALENNRMLLATTELTSDCDIESLALNLDKILS